MSTNDTIDIDVSYKILTFNDGEKEIGLTLTNAQNDEELLSHLVTFLEDTNNNGGYLPQQTFKSLLNDIKCECFDERDEEDKLTPSSDAKNNTALHEAYRTFSSYLQERDIELSDYTQESINTALDYDTSPKVDTKVKPNKPDKEPRQTSVPIAVHKSADWDEKKAVKLVKQAAMHYYNGIAASAKATGLEGISNVPTWFIAATNPTPEMLKAAGAGAALTIAIGVEASTTFGKFNRVLSHLEEFETNRQDPISKKDALTILEQRTHEAGLLYEGIEDLDLKDYPVEKFKNLMFARKLVMEKGALKDSIDDVCRYLYLNPQKSLLSFGKNTPILLTKATFALTRATISIPLQATKDIGTNILTPKHWKNIGSGIKTIPSMLMNFKVLSNTSRHKVKQKSHFTDAAEGRITEGHTLHGHIPPDFIKEVHETNKALPSNILQQKVEAIKFTTEGLFIKEHAMTMLDTYDDSVIEGLMSGEPTPKNIRFAISAFSVFAVWGPFSHMGKKLTELFNVGTSARSQQAQQYAKLDKFHEDMLTAQKEERELGEEETGEHADNDNTPNDSDENTQNQDHNNLN
ncbi:MAG: hypothetical protein COB36_00655 [Alphaproteobacteria bacterium]|nr:MAG: hypothetical protein COB36_00655 [Alphaproteobacteria bacterium]